ncbi:MAG: domain S-box protein [Euryarchaeota archaeon]|nr:domain S-box protein [Euryarchaeota archaeon]
MSQNRNSIHCPYQGKKDKIDNESFSFPCMSQRLMRVSYDITGIKKAETKLKETLDSLDKLVKERTAELEEAYKTLLENEKRLNEAQKIAHLGNWDWDLVTDELYWSDEVYRIFGSNPQEFGATYDAFLNCVHTDDRGYVDNVIKEALLDGEPYEIDYSIVLAEEGERIVHAQGKVVFDEKRTPVQVRGTVQDVTEHKRTEKALQENESRFRNLFEVISSGVAIYDVIDDGHDFIFKDINAAGACVNHVQRENIIGKSLYEFFPNVGEMGLDAAFRRVWLTGRTEFFPSTLYEDERITLWVTNWIYKLPSGELVAVFEDITERKKAEEKIQTLANAVESSDDAIMTKSLDGIILSWNKGAERTYGYSAEEIIGKNISILEPDDIKGEIKHFSEKIKRGEKIQHYETLRLKKDGTKINVSVTLSPIFDVSGDIKAFSAIVRDITERIKADEKIRLSNIYNRSLIESSLDTLVTIGRDGKITDVNIATEKVTGYSRNELIGTDFLDYFTEPGKAKKVYQQVFREGLVRDYLLKIKTEDGRATPVLFNASVFKDEHDEIIGVFAAARDITERINAEEALVKIEKVRIKEIHHRIKNNLQVISSLLDLQAEKFEDENVIEAFKEGQNRVISMSLLHEELYNGEGTDKLDFSSYTKRLAGNLFKTYNLYSKNVHLSMELEDNAFLDMDTAVPLGIIVNELISNSLKHAFTEKHEGKIRIGLCSDAEMSDEMKKSVFILTISDDGKGMPEDFEFESAESLGLELVSILVDQLNGEIELNRSQGTEFRITFNVKEK